MIECIFFGIDFSNSMDSCDFVYVAAHYGQRYRIRREKKSMRKYAAVLTGMMFKSIWKPNNGTFHIHRDAISVKVTVPTKLNYTE